jgi:hypothetical protein
MFAKKSAGRRVPLIAPVLALVALLSLGAGGPVGAKSQAGQRPRGRRSCSCTATGRTRHRGTA